MLMKKKMIKQKKMEESVKIEREARAPPSALGPPQGTCNDQVRSGSGFTPVTTRSQHGDLCA